MLKPSSPLPLCLFRTSSSSVTQWPPGWILKTIWETCSTRWATHWVCWSDQEVERRFRSYPGESSCFAITRKADFNSPWHHQTPTPPPLRESLWCERPQAKQSVFISATRTLLLFCRKMNRLPLRSSPHKGQNALPANFLQNPQMHVFTLIRNVCDAPMIFLWNI